MVLEEEGINFIDSCWSLYLRFAREVVLVLVGTFCLISYVGYWIFKHLFEKSVSGFMATSAWHPVKPSVFNFDKEDAGSN